MTDNVENQANEESVAQDTSNELTLNDLNAMKIIIDIASSRGAFKPNEMVPVGTVYNKLEKFLAAAQAAQAAAKAPEANA